MKPIPTDEMNFDLLWEADEWDCTYTAQGLLEESLENGEVFEVVRIGVARRARDIYAVPYRTGDVGGLMFAYFETEADADAFAKAKRKEYHEADEAEGAQ